MTQMLAGSIYAGLKCVLVLPVLREMRYLICKLTSHRPALVIAGFAGFNHYWKVPQIIFITAATARGNVLTDDSFDC